jgi:CubicO group peptidase (beta-lactamase class C family)
MWCPPGGGSGIIGADDAGVWSGQEGERLTPFPWASVTKLFTAYACMIAIEEGTVTAADAISGFTDVTLAHLLAHAGGIDFEEPVQTRPAGTRRVYSNASIRLAVAHVERLAGIPFEQYVRIGVLEPLEIHSVRLGDPAAGASGSVHDLTRFAIELLKPRLISAETLAWATKPWFASLNGVVPGFGPQHPCPWGLGFEIKGQKHHWMGTTTSPESFGHFGQSGSMLCVDPIRQRAWCSLSPVPFGPWAIEQWPAFIDDPLIDWNS